MGLSPRNPRVVAAARLHRAEERARRGLTLLEGPHLVEEAVKAWLPFSEVFALAGDELAAGWASPGQPTLVGEEALSRLSSTRAPQSPVAVIEIPTQELDPARSVLVAFGISDPGNLGTMIRTAAAFGLDVAVTGGSADPWSPKVLRAGMGGHFHTAVVRIDDLASLPATTVAAVSSGGVPARHLPPGRLAILIGSEAEGLPDEVIDQADVRVSIPMLAPADSLNAAVAAAILAYEVELRSR